MAQSGSNHVLSRKNIAVWNKVVNWEHKSKRKTVTYGFSLLGKSTIKACVVVNKEQCDKRSDASVSYTHLDVYKRQTKYSEICK